MRRSLLAAASLAALAAAPGWAQEATEIDEEVTEPVETATADEGAASDIVITSTGRVVLAADRSGPAVLVNSDNSLTTQSGSRVEILGANADGSDRDIDGATGVQMASGVDGDLEINGAVTLSDAYAAVDSEEEEDRRDFDGDGDLDPDGEADGPFARDRNKTGVLIGEVDSNHDAVAGQAPVDGSATFGSGSAVNVAGQDSYGVRVVSGLTGDLTAGGAVTIRGERSVGVSVESDVGGDVQIRNINAETPDGHGAVIAGDVGGGLRLTGSINVNGYRINSRLTEELFQLLDEGDDDIDARSAVVIAGSIQNGVFIGAGSSVRQVSGSGAAVEIGRGGETVTIGETVLPDDFNNAEPDEDEDPEPLGQALVNEGSVLAASLYDGRDATAFLVGGRDANGLLRMVVLEAGGFRNENSIEATAYDGDARGVVFGAGAQATQTAESGLSNAGTITATSVLGHEDDGFGAVDDPDTAENEADYGSGRAFAIVLGEGSQISRLLNERGAIIARIRGGGRSATAITVENDATGLIENSGVIRAEAIALTEEFEENPDRIQLVAIDASGATQDLRIVQTETFDDEGELVATASITGDILFGSGNDTLDLQGGTVNGDVRFGAGADRLIIRNATLTGGVTDSDGDLVVDVSDEGRLVLTGSGSLDLTEATFGDGGVLEIEVDSTARAAAFLRASGDITFAAGSDLSISLDNLVGESAQLNILTAGGALTIADEDVLQTTDAPFLYEASLARSEADADTLVLSLRRKTADEIGLDESRAGAYREAIAAFEAVEELGRAFAAVRTQEEFFGAYDQLLPEYATSAIQFALASNDAAQGALSVRLANARLAPDELAGVWAQEFGYYADRSANAFGAGYRGQGVGLAIGLDRPVGPFYAVGVNLLGSASEVEEVEGFDEPMVALSGQIGTYAGLDLGGIDVSGALSLGYDFFESERNILIGEFSSTNTAEWSGWHVSASAKAGRDFTFNRWIVRPEASLTYLSLFESGYTETAEDPDNDRLALIVDDRESAALLGAATLTVSRRFGTDLSWWAPSINVGYRGDFLSEENTTTARFGEAGSPFTLRSSTLSGSGVLLGFGLSAGSNYSTFSLAYDADVRDDFVRHVARLVIRLTF